MNLISVAPVEDRHELFLEAKQQLGIEFVEPALYYESDLTRDKFSRVPMDKTGSETTLLGGIFKHVMIIRHIQPSSFEVWRMLYEDYEFWRDQGFDYVPIEPVVSFRQRKTGMVDVWTGVLDLSLSDWFSRGGNFGKELTEDRERIKRAIRRHHVIHGHDNHDNNFCLRFFRKKMAWLILIENHNCT